MAAVRPDIPAPITQRSTTCFCDFNDDPDRVLDDAANEIDLLVRGEANASTRDIDIIAIHIESRKSDGTDFIVLYQNAQQYKQQPTNSVGECECGPSDGPGTCVEYQNEQQYQQSRAKNTVGEI